MKVINSQLLTNLRTGFMSLFLKGSTAAAPIWPQIAMKVISTSSSMTYAWLGKTTRIREWIGDRTYQNLKLHSYAIVNKDFEGTVSVDRNDILDDNIGTYGPLMEMLGADAATHPDELIHALLIAGFTTNCYDGQYFFDTDHPVLDANGDAQSVSNSGGGSGAPWFLLDTSKPIKPLIYQLRQEYQFVAKDDPKDDNVFDRKEFVYGVDGRSNVGYGLWQLAYGSKQTLDATSANAGIVAMQSIKSDNGKPLGADPTIILVGPTNAKAAREVFEAERDANGKTNTMRGLVKVVVTPYL